MVPFASSLPWWKGGREGKQFLKGYIHIPILYFLDTYRYLCVILRKIDDYLECLRLCLPKKWAVRTWKLPPNLIIFPWGESKKLMWGHRWLLKNHLSYFVLPLEMSSLGEILSQLWAKRFLFKIQSLNWIFCVLEKFCQNTALQFVVEYHLVKVKNFGFLSPCLKLDPPMVQYCYILQNDRRGTCD